MSWAEPLSNVLFCWILQFILVSNWGIFRWNSCLADQHILSILENYSLYIACEQSKCFYVLLIMEAIGCIWNIKTCLQVCSELLVNYILQSNASWICTCVTNTDVPLWPLDYSYLKNAVWVPPLISCWLCTGQKSTGFELFPWFLQSLRCVAPNTVTCNLPPPS